MANDALRYVLSKDLSYLMILREAMASCAIEGNRAGEICGETLDRVLNQKPVSDRYIMGLALFISDIQKGI